MAIIKSNDKPSSELLPPDAGQPDRLSRQKDGPNLRNIKLVIGREYKARVFRRSFVISTLILVIMAVGAISVPLIIQVITTKLNLQTKLVYINQAGEVGGQSLATYLDYRLNNSAASSDSSLTGNSSYSSFNITEAQSKDFQDSVQQVKDKKLDILLIIGRSANQELTFKYLQACPELVSGYVLCLFLFTFFHTLMLYRYWL